MYRRDLDRSTHDCANTTYFTRRSHKHDVLHSAITQTRRTSLGDHTNTTYFTRRSHKHDVLHSAITQTRRTSLGDHINNPGGRTVFIVISKHHEYSTGLYTNRMTHDQFKRIGLYAPGGIRVFVHCVQVRSVYGEQLDLFVYIRSYKYWRLQCRISVVIL